MTDDKREVPVGQWVDVPKGMVAAPDTYIDDKGVMRSSGDNSVVCWHWGPKHCERKGIQPNELIYDEATGAPWCPECWPIRQAFYETKRTIAEFEKLFADDPK
jgi:hypothetical protein